MVLTLNIVTEKLEPVEIICMKCQNQFSGKYKKTISGCHLLKILPTELSVTYSIKKSQTKKIYIL